MLEILKSSLYIIHIKYRVVQKSVKLKYSVVLTVMFRFKVTSQFVERYRSAVICAVDMEVLILNNFCKFSKW
jgi:hypothetical protein